MGAAGSSGTGFGPLVSWFACSDKPPWLPAHLESNNTTEAQKTPEESALTAFLLIMFL